MNTSIHQRIATILQERNMHFAREPFAHLRETAPSEALDALIAHLRSSDRIIRRGAAEGLVEFRHLLAPKAAEVVKHLEDNDDPQTRWSCAISLTSTRTPSVDRAYLRALADPFDQVVKVACEEIGVRGVEGGIEALDRMLVHPSWDVRLAACRGLITLKAAGQRVVSMLEAMSRDPEADDYDADIEHHEAEVINEPGDLSLDRMETILAQARQVADQNQSRSGQ